MPTNMFILYTLFGFCVAGMFVWILASCFHCNCCYRRGRAYELPEKVYEQQPE